MQLKMIERSRLLTESPAGGERCEKVVIEKKKTKRNPKDGKKKAPSQ